MTKSETISREENIRCRLCICEAVEYFREGLRLFVPLRLESACGPNWIPKVNDRIDEENKKKGIKRQRTSRLRVSTNGKKVQWDSRSLLKAIHFTFKDAFQEEFECTQYRVTWLWKQLNGFSHEKSFYFKGTELTLKGMEYILKAAKSLEQAKLVEGVRRRLVDESPAVLTPSDKPRSPMEAGQSMSKPEARRHAQRCGVSLADIRFANINRTKPSVWFFHIPLKNIQREGDITLLLYDNRNSKLHCLQVPTAYFKQNQPKLRVRDDKDCISLELSTGKPDLFRDTIGKGRISFAQFHRGEC